MKTDTVNRNVCIKYLGLVDYEASYIAMHEFTQNRNASTLDEIWVLEHPQIFTQGRAGKEEHILQRSSIPIFQSDRGGQVTFHGPGQLIVYPLINLKRLNLNIRQFVSILEMSVINTLARYSIKAYARKDAPGVYVDTSSCYGLDELTEQLTKNHTFANKATHVLEKKICSLGLKVSKGCTLHGLALNIDIDLTPFDFINPCGLLGMQMTSMADLCHKPLDKNKITDVLIAELLNALTP